MKKLVLALTLMAFSGCTQLIAKDSAWDELVDRVARDALLARESHSQPLVAEAEGGPPAFLGVRVRTAVAPFQLGAPVLHVFPGSPAASAGLLPGDEIRSLGGKAIRTAVDLRSVLYEVTELGRKPVLVFARKGQEIKGEVEPQARELWLADRRVRLVREAQVRETSIPFFFRRTQRSLPPEAVHAHYGTRPPGRVVVSDDVDILPAFLSFSLVRVELMPLLEGNRVSLLWPIEIETQGDDVSWDLRGLVAPPQGAEDL